MIRPLLVSFLAFSSFACVTTSRAAEASAPAILPAAAHAHPLRVMTFNIQSGRHGLTAVAKLIRAQDPDVVALEEVDSGTSRCGGVNQAKELAALAGFPHFEYFRATAMYGGNYGIALLSKHPILHAEQLPLPVPRETEPRTVARALLDVDGSKLSVYVTHLSNAPFRSAIRARQAEFIARWMDGDPHPRVLMGDFNDVADSPAVLLLSRHLSDVFARAGQGAATTYPLPFPLPDLRLDYVLASKDLTPLRAFVVRKLASDHWPLVAEFARPSTPGSSPELASSKQP